MSSPKEQAMNWIMHNIDSGENIQKAIDIALKAQAEAIFKEINDWINEYEIDINVIEDKRLDLIKKKWLGDEK